MPEPRDRPIGGVPDDAVALNGRIVDVDLGVVGATHPDRVDLRIPQHFTG